MRAKWHAIACIFSAVFVTSSNAADWPAWQLENSIAHEGDWLVVKSTKEGFCTLWQSHNSDSSKLSILVGRSWVPDIIPPFHGGVTGDITYQVDDREPDIISEEEFRRVGGIELPRAIIPALKAGKVLKMHLTPVGEAPRSQNFSLAGFAAASRWLDKDICQFEASKEASGADGTTFLDVHLERTYTGKIRLIGETSLPDGMALILSLRNVEAYFFGQHKVVVTDGRFRSGRFSNRGDSLPFGRYEISISSSLPMIQPKHVRAVIGERGEKLSGPAIITKDGDRRVDWYVQRDIGPKTPVQSK